MGEKSMQNLVHAYHAGIAAQVKAVIETWEAELNANAEYD